MLDYILAVYLNSEPEYVGTFIDCHDAEKYVRMHYPNHNSICQYREYIVLPADLKEKFYVPYPAHNGTYWIEQKWPN